MGLCLSMSIQSSKDTEDTRKIQKTEEGQTDRDRQKFLLSSKKGITLPPAHFYDEHIHIALQHNRLVWTVWNKY